MKRYHLVNNIIGWLVGIAACIVYIMTAEATASWWDCGEYAATAFKMQVGHPPGAPSFQLFGRLFSMFSEPESAARAINIMSAVCSGLGIMFLYWSITLLGKMLLRGQKVEIQLSDYRVWAVFAAGVVGAMAYCFSDTYWFSAVESEVYAMSSFFTAVVFWAILKWEEQSDDPHSLRWIVLICFLVGIAIGVHLLNLLTIPAICYVVYFKKWKEVTPKGFIITGIISVVLLAIVLWGIIPGIVNVSSAFDVFFVNKLHLGFNSGTIVFFLLLATLIVLGLWYTSPKKKNKPVANASILGFLMLLLGYSTFFILVIRANTNTPLNENAPKDAVAMRAYLGREQYGETPLMSGQYYTAGNPIDFKEGYTKYIRSTNSDGKDQYVEKDKARSGVYREDHTGVFPRMYSNDEKRGHPQFYKYWAGDPPRGEKPTMGQNLKFFHRYQMGWMYWRYFMWNFAGRQNDIQGHYFNDDGTRDYMNGNWISGIKFIDEMRLGPQDNLPDAMKNNKARNTYFLLPLLLGLIGLVYECIKDKRSAFIVFAMFFMTGIAIGIYLNMPPRQPRERDYAFVGSFYFFAIWIGLGVMALIDWIMKLFKNTKVGYAVTFVVFALCMLAVPVRMCAQNWDDHDRSQKTAARDFAKNYLGSVNKNSILITYGDNDTFPLWYAQEIEGWRTDVRILNYTLAGMHWYIEQLYNKLYESDPLPMTLPYEDFYGLGHDLVILQDNSAEYVEVADLLSLLRDHPDRFTVINRGEKMLLIPTKRMKITVNLDNLVKKGVITDEQATHINPEIRFDLKSDVLYRHELMMLDIIGTNRFERDIYTVNPSYIRNAFPIVDHYCVEDGMVFKLIPYPAQQQFTDQTVDYFLKGAKNADGSYDALEWGNLDRDIYVDPISLNSGNVQRQTYAMLARDLLTKGDTATARTLLDMGDKYFPKKNFAHDKFCLSMIEIYAAAYGKEKATELWNDIYDYYKQDIDYIAQYATSKNRNFVNGTNARLREDCQIFYTLADYAKRFLGNDQLSAKATETYQPYQYALYTQQPQPQTQQAPAAGIGY